MSASLETACATALLATSHVDRQTYLMLVLVADDDRAVRESLERALQLAGYEVDLAVDGDAALSAIERRTPTPSCST